MIKPLVIESKNIERHYGYTQEKLAEEIDVSINFLTMLENGKSGMSLTTMIKICKTLNISPNELLQDFIKNYNGINDEIKILGLIDKLSNKERTLLFKIIKLVINE